MVLRISVVLLVIIVTALANVQEIAIIPGGPVEKRPIGESFMFSCKASGISEELDPFLKWFDKDGNEITETNGERKIERSDVQRLKLLFVKAKFTDAGMYRCTGQIDGNEMFDEFKLLMFKAITFEDVPKVQNPEIHTDALIKCIVSAQPTPLVYWHYRGKKIVTGGRYLQTQNGLSISNITEEDNGMYSCRAEVLESGEYDVRDIHVVVYIPPVIQKGPSDVEGVEKTEAVLDCKATGKPAPKYNFYKGTSNVPILGNKRIIVDHDSGSLLFQRLSRDDEGEYRCVAKNDVGEAERQGTLTVIVPPELLELKNRTKDEGQSDTLRCVMFGRPMPQLTFQKAGQLPYSDGENENGRIIVTTVKPGTLDMTFSSLEPDDTSNYTCVAKNVGGMLKQNGTMTVHFKPYFAPDHPNEVYNWAGKVRNLTCNALGEPVPAVHWVHFGRRLETNETYKIYEMGRNSVLQVTIRAVDEGWIYGPYTCVATNILGTGQTEINMIRAVTPEKPRNIHLKDSDPNRVILALDPPASDGGVKIMAYVVRYDGQEVVKKIDEDIVIEGLQAGTNYIFEVLAKNAVGYGQSEKFVHTTESVREPYPVDIISDPIGDYPFKYTVTWSKPRTGGVPIVKYEFRYRQVEVVEGSTVARKSSSDWMNREVEDDVNAPMLSYTIRNLKPHSHYALEVTAHNDIGPSAVHGEFVFQTQKDAGHGASRPQSAGMGTGAVIGIVIVVFIIFLIIVDVSCYFMNGCGVLKCCCVRVCGRTEGGAAEKEMEAGESEKKPLKEGVEEEPLDTEDQLVDDANPLKDEVAVEDEKAELKKEMHADEEDDLVKTAPEDEVANEKTADELPPADATTPTKV